MGNSHPVRWSYDTTPLSEQATRIRLPNKSAPMQCSRLFGQASRLRSPALVNDETITARILGDERVSVG
jgi:hypothetical protein